MICNSHMLSDHRSDISVWRTYDGNSFYFIFILIKSVRTSSRRISFSKRVQPRLFSFTGEGNFFRLFCCEVLPPNPKTGWSGLLFIAQKSSSPKVSSDSSPLESQTKGNTPHAWICNFNINLRDETHENSVLIQLSWKWNVPMKTNCLLNQVVDVFISAAVLL